MSAWSSERSMRNAHRWVAMTAIGFLFLSLMTGLLWANAPYLYWADRYKEKVRTLPTPSLEQASISLSTAVQTSKADTNGPAQVERVTLRSDGGRVLYDVRLRTDRKVRTVLVDATTGLRLSPLSPEFARDLAKQYVGESAEIIDVSPEQYTPRKKHHAQEAIRVRFNDRNQTEIVLDSHTGEILEDEGRWRKLHFFVMQLHQLNFFGFEKTLLNIPGVPLFLMGVTGAVLWRKQIIRKRRIKLQETAGALITKEKPLTS